MENGKWRVIALFNEQEEDEPETTIMYERAFRDYYEMQNYVSDCRVNGCIGGQVYRGLQDGRWEYYMEII